MPPEPLISKLGIEPFDPGFDAKWLKKGAMVELFGRVGVNAYLNSEGKAVASLTFHTSNIKILVFVSDSQPLQASAVPAKNSKKEQPDDLPF